MDREKVAIDVWLAFTPCPNSLHGVDCDCAEEATYEANTYPAGDGYVVKWYHTAVGQVSSRYFETYEAAREWLESEGFQDFSS